MNKMGRCRIGRMNEIMTALDMAYDNISVIVEVRMFVHKEIQTNVIAIIKELSKFFMEIRPSIIEMM